MIRRLPASVASLRRWAAPSSAGRQLQQQQRRWASSSAGNQRRMQIAAQQQPTAAQSSAGSSGRRIPVAGLIAAGASACLYRLATDEGPATDEGLPRTYDAQLLMAFWAQHPFVAMRRRLEILGELVPFFTGLICDKFISGRLADDEVKKQYAVAFKEMLTRLGPTFIKGGQALSIRPDVIPPVALYELQKLCDQVPSFPNEVAMAMIEDELGQPVDKLFRGLTVGTDPIAAASLGQVYKCRTLAGELVAVKVQRPDMLQQVSLDHYLLRQIFQAVETVKGIITHQLPHDVALFEAFARGSYLELDYVNEARNQERFIRELLPKEGMRGQVYVPAVHWATTSRKVLTSEWCEGEKLASSSPEVINKLVPVGVQCFLTQLLDLGFFHCDPHPGNLLVSPDGQLVLLDFGLCSELDKPASRSMTKAIVHLMNGDFEALVAEDAVALGFLPPDADTARILPPVQAILQQGLLEPGSNLHRRAKRFKAISNDLNQVFFDFPFSVPDYFALVTRSLGVLEGIALAGDPEFDIFTAAEPYARQHAMAIFGPGELGQIAGEAIAQGGIAKVVSNLQQKLREYAPPPSSPPPTR